MFRLQSDKSWGVWRSSCLSFAVFFLCGMVGLGLLFAVPDERVNRAEVQAIKLPPLPEKDAKVSPSRLLDLNKLNGRCQEWSVELLDRAKRYRLKKVEQEKLPRWKVVTRNGGDGEKTIAQMAIREGHLLFAWSKKNTGDGSRLALEKVSLVLLDTDGRKYEFPLGSAKIVASHHGYNPSHATPHEVVHEYEVAGLPDKAKLKLKVECPFRENPLMVKSERARTVRLGRELFVEFEPFGAQKGKAKRLKLKVLWKLERPKRGEKNDDPDRNKLLVRQQILYDLGVGKGRLLTRDNLKSHIKQLQTEIINDGRLMANFQRQVQALQGQLAGVQGAQPGSREWAQQTLLNNQVKQAARRYRQAGTRQIKGKENVWILQQFEQNQLDQVLESFDGVPYPYQVVIQDGDYEVPVIESRTWGITEADCVPLVGKWREVNEAGEVKADGWEMIVTEDYIETIIGETRSKIYFYHGWTEVISPCVTESKAMQAYEDVGKFYFKTRIYSSTSRDSEVLLTREFWIEHGDADIAREKMEIYQEDWVTHEIIRYEWSDGDVWTRRLGEKKKEFREEEKFWRRIQ